MITNIRFTNQKLASAEIHLQQLQTELPLGAGDAPKTLMNAHCQAVIFDLVLACHAFMQEIAADYQQNIAIGGSYADLELLLTESNVVCQQCTWLAELESQHDSWLSWLYGEYQKCWTNAVLSSAVDYDKGVNDTHLIAFKDISSMKIEDKLKNCFEELELIIAQYRQLMQEW